MIWIERVWFLKNFGGWTVFFGEEMSTQWHFLVRALHTATEYIDWFFLAVLANRIEIFLMIWSVLTYRYIVLNLQHIWVVGKGWIGWVKSGCIGTVGKYCHIGCGCADPESCSQSCVRVFDENVPTTHIWKVFPTIPLLWSRTYECSRTSSIDHFQKWQLFPTLRNLRAWRANQRLPNPGLPTLRVLQEPEQLAQQNSFKASFENLNIAYLLQFCT